MRRKTKFMQESTNITEQMRKLSREKAIFRKVGPRDPITGRWSRTLNRAVEPYQTQRDRSPRQGPHQGTQGREQGGGDGVNYTAQQNPDGTWSPATPIGWMEEHGRIARFILWVRGIEHCNDREGQRRKRF